MTLVNKRLRALLGGLGLLAAAPAMGSGWGELNMTQGVTPISREVYDLHMLIMWICVAIGVVVFGAILYSIVKFRKSKGVVPAQFHHSTTVEIIWTVIPMLILVSMAIPATRVLIAMDDTSNADVTVQVTAYQWKWGYKYLDEDVSFYSTLARDDNFARQLGSQIAPTSVENYLLNVDNELVLPVGKKIRFLITAAPRDVIHAWWVPAFGWKQDAIPGFINEGWTFIEKEGVYRGQCTELCGRDHAFMPIVVRAVSEPEYRAWLAQQKSGAQPAAVAETAAAPAASAPAATAPAAAPAELSRDALLAKGKQVYTTACAGCHMPGGEGMPPAFKALKGSPIANGDAAEHIRVVVKGVPGTAMAPFGHMSDEDLAAVITYERLSWGNTGTVVQPADVRAAR